MIRHRLPVWFAVLLGIVAVFTLGFLNYCQDDVFITYVYSRNLASGAGFVFNPGEQVQGTTTPLWTLAMAAGWFLDPNMLHIGNILSGLCLLLAAWAVFRLLAPLTSRWAGLAAALVLVTSPLHYVSFGMETMLYCAVLAAAWLAWSRGRPGLAMVCAAALTWTRADGVVLAGAILLLVLFAQPGHLRGRLRNALRLGIIYALAIGPWVVFAWLYFGSLLPNTFSAKQELFSGLDFILEGYARWQTFYGVNLVNVAAVPLVVCGLIVMIRRPGLRPLGLVALWAVLYAAGYTALNITNFWYYTPLVSALVVLACAGAWGISQWMRARVDAQTFLTASPALVLITFAVFVPNALHAWSFRQPPPRMATYELAGRWISEHTPPDSTLLVADLGVAGFYAQRRTLDSFGLITPGLHERLPEPAIAQFQPDYVLATQYYFWGFTQGNAFREVYEPLARFSSAGDGEFSPMTLFRRRSAAQSLEVIAPFVIASETAAWPFARLERVAVNGPVWSGGELAVDLAWSFTAETDLSVFVHVLDQQGRIVTQSDRVLMVTSEDGSQVQDQHRFQVPPDAPDGVYALRIGWYDWRTLARTPLSDGRDFVEIPQAVVIRFPGGSGLP